MKRLLPVFLALFCAAIARAQATPEAVNGIAVIVNDRVITIKDVRQAIQEDAEFLNRRYAGQPKVLDDKMKTLMQERLDQMVSDYLVLQDFEKLGKPLPDSYIDNRVNEDIKR